MVLDGRACGVNAAVVYMSAAVMPYRRASVRGGNILFCGWLFRVRFFFSALTDILYRSLQALLL